MLENYSFSDNIFENYSFLFDFENYSILINFENHFSLRLRELLNSHQLRESLFSSTSRITRFSSTSRITFLIECENYSILINFENYFSHQLRELFNSHQLWESLFSATFLHVVLAYPDFILPCWIFLKQISGEKNISHNMYLGVSITTYQHTRAGANKCSLPGLRIFKALRVYCIHHKISSCISLYWNLALSLHSCEQDIIQEFSCYCQRTSKQTNFSMIWLSVLLVDCWRPWVDDRGPCYNLSGKQYDFSNRSYPQKRSSFLFCVETVWGMIYALHSSAEATQG